MKKKILNTVLALSAAVLGLMATGLDAQAATQQVSWDVNYTGSKLESSYSADKATFTQMMPGDTAIYQVTYKNTSDKTADFYMESSVISSLEDTSLGGGSSSAKDGAYSYAISYTIDGKATSIYDSKTVGGDSGNTLEGLNQVQTNLKNNQGAYVYVGQLAAGKSGVVTIQVDLDGNTQDNSYMERLAKLDIQFAVENVTTTVNHTSNTEQVVYTLPGGTEVVTITVPSTPTSGGNPKTGDSILPLILCGAGLGLGIILIILYFVMTGKQKKEGR